MANPGGGVRKAAAAAESNAGKWKRPGLQIRKALEVEERKPQERSTGRGSAEAHLGTGGCGDDSRRVGSDKSVTMQCLLKESEFHSVEDAETLRRDTVRADSGRPHGDNVKHR